MVYYSYITQSKMWGIKMSSTIENVRYTVYLKQGMCFSTTEQVQKEYEVIDSRKKYPYNTKERKIEIEEQRVPVLGVKSTNKIHTVLKEYDQIPCMINGRLSSIVVDKNDGTARLHSELVEDIQNENARIFYNSASTYKITQYLSYGFEFELEDCIFRYGGFLTPYDRDRFCFEQTGSMFHGSVENIEIDMHEVDFLAERIKENRQKIKKII